MPNSKTFKVIIDINLWVSFLIGKELVSLKELIVNGQVQPVFSKESLEELKQVTQRPKLQKYFPPEKVNELLLFLNAISLFVEIQSNVKVCRDPKDNFLLAIAQESQADYLITGDQDLLILERFQSTKIISYRNLLSILFSKEQ
jgi:hypothetical protein